MDHPPRRAQPRAPLVWVPGCALLALGAEYLPAGWALGWVAWALPLAALSGGAAAQAHGARARSDGVAGWAAAGWAYGLVYWAGQFAWLHPALVWQAGMGGLHFVNFFALLVTALALIPAGALALARYAWLARRVSPLVVLPVLLAAQDALLGVQPFGGLAWGSLAGPQTHTLAARAVVPLLGGAGLVLLLGLVNAGWAAWLRATQAAWRAGNTGRRLALGGAALALLTGLCAWPAPLPEVPGAAPETPGTAQKTLSVATPVTALLVPGALSLETLNAQRDTPAPLRYYLARTLAAADAAQRPDDTGVRTLPRLVVWPESAVPGAVARGKSLVELSALGGLLDADFLLGSNAVEYGREYNALYLVSGGPFEFWRYDKRNRVPFGEYVPAGFRWLFPRKVAAGDADYAAGAAPPVLDWRGRRLGVAICFESILPGHARMAVRQGAELLVAVANDAWLTPAAQRQHLRLTALRGLEVARDVLLVANRGWSGLLRGGQAVVLLDWRGEPRAVRAGLRAGRTPFVRWGLLPLAGVAALLLALAVACAWPRRRGA